MTAHICDVSKKVPWDKIKLSISGRKKKTDTFTCGGCNKTFETICYLHIHCLRHNEGGSYYFDNVTNTAFPKHDTICSSTQLTMDSFDDVCETDKVVPCVPRFINDSFVNDTTDLCPENSSDELVTNERCSNNVVEVETTEPFNGMDKIISDSKVSIVKVRNISKTENGSVVFEMDKQDAHLLDRTAQKVMEVMSKFDNRVLDNSNELEVMVSIEDERSLSHVGMETTTSLLNDNETCNGEHFLAQIKVQNETGDGQQNRTVAMTSNNKTDDGRGQVCPHSSVLQSMEVSGESKSVIEEGKAIEHSNDHIIISHDKKQSENYMVKDSNKSKPVSSCKTDLEIPVLTRSSRKRKLTPKMKECVLARSLFPLSDSTDNNYVSDKRKKTKVSQDSTKPSKSLEADIYASEALLSLSVTNGSTDKKKTSEIDTKIDSFNEENESGHKEVPKLTETMDDSVSPEISNGNELSDKLEPLHTVDVNDDRADMNEIDDDDDNQIHDLDDDFVPKTLKQKSKTVQKPRKRNSECKTCGKVGTRAMIKYHQQMHMTDKKFNCNKCGKTLKTAACLRSHMKTHGEKEWKCDLCPAAFFRKAYLETHKTNHTGVYPYICDLCGMKFKMPYILQRHINSVHKNIRRYKCDICQRGFFRASTRDQHRVRHFDPSLKCSYCPKMFKADLDLRKHELTHTGDKLFFCPLCNHGFSQIWPYYKHMWAIHQIQKDEAKKMKINNPEMKNMKKTNSSSSLPQIPIAGKIDPKSNKYFASPIDRGTEIVHSKPSDSGLLTSEIDECNLTGDRTEASSMIYSTSNVDITDTIVLDIGENLDVNNTIVIQSDNIHTVDNSTGFIVVDDGHGDSNIVVLSEFPETEIQHIVDECGTSS